MPKRYKTTHQLKYIITFRFGVLPGDITHLHKNSPSVLHLPLWVLAIDQIKNSKSFVASAGLSLGENHFPTNSLTWRELLIGLTTFLFNHGPDNPLLQHTPRLSSSQVRKIVTVQHSFTQE
jgi:hypothetical protein